MLTDLTDFLRNHPTARLSAVTQTRLHKGFQGSQNLFELSFEPRTLVAGWSRSPTKRSKSPPNFWRSSRRSSQSENKKHEGPGNRGAKQASRTTEIGSTYRSKDCAFFAIHRSSPRIGTCVSTLVDAGTKPSVCVQLIKHWRKNEQLRNGEKYRIISTQAGALSRKISTNALTTTSSQSRKMFRRGKPKNKPFSGKRLRSRS